MSISSPGFSCHAARAARSSGIRRTAPSGISRLLVACAVLFLILIWAPRLFAQTATGSIAGTVTEKSGNVVAGATVSLINTETNEVRAASTNDSGYYSIPLLPPADYRLSVAMQGFSKFVQSNIHLNVGDALTVNAALQIGGVAQEVTVTGQPSSLETETSSLGQVLGNKTILDLPVNGRNSYSFATLVPGVLASAGFTQTAFDEYNDQFVSINGSRPNQNVFLLDGGMNTQPALSGPGYYPSIDLVQEYKVQTNNFSAEFSNTSGGVINVITKSGTNHVHGSLYEFFRDTGLNANDYFANNAGLPRAPFHYNQFGASVGGPIVHDKSFYFFSYEGLRWTQAVTTTATLPTLAQRTGDFSQTRNASGQVIPIYDPFSTVPDPSNPGQYLRTQFAGNKIPANRVDPVAANLMGYIPPPNRPGDSVTGANNFISNTSSPITKNEFSLRIDQALTQNSKIFGRFSIADTSQVRPPIFGSDPKFKVSAPILGPDTLRQMQTTIGDTTVLSPSTVLELNSSFIRFHLARRPPGQGFDPTQLGFPSYFSDLAKTTVPCFPTAVVGGLGSSESIPNIGWGGLLGQLCWIGILNDANQVFHEFGNLTKVAGTHVLKVGGDFGTGMFTTSRFNNGAGFYDFGPDFTQGPNPFAAGASGVGTASFLLGTGDSGFNYSGGPDEINSFKYYGGYVQDDWKVTSRLTLNLGIRYDYETPWRERFNRITGWDPTAASPLQVPGLNLVGGLDFPGSNGLSRYHFDPDRRTGVQPRLGFAFALSDTTALRGGYGIYMGPVVGSGYNGNGVPSTGFLGSTPWVTTLDGVTPLNRLSNPFPTGFTYPTGSSLGLATELGQSVVAMDRHRPTSY
jgi:outer membrane receptor protein involved in Fe transport